MSETWLRIIPIDPNYVPDAARQGKAVQLFQSLVSEADDIHVRITEMVQFIDQGTNFERVVCHNCHAEISTGWWQHAMDTAHEEHFSNLDIITPCCHTTMSLNDLDYEWPAGFARFRLEAMNPNIASLPQEWIDRMAPMLGCPHRIIWAQY
jgi:hypothetical protein